MGIMKGENINISLDSCIKVLKIEIKQKKLKQKAVSFFRLGEFK